MDYLRRDCLSASLGDSHAIYEVQGRAPGPRGATDCLQIAPDQIELLTSDGGWGKEGYLKSRYKGELRWTASPDYTDHHCIDLPMGCSGREISV